MAKKVEPSRHVHKPWAEQTTDCNIEWRPKERDSYTGPHGDGMCGPTSGTSEAALGGLASLFFISSLRKNPAGPQRCQTTMHTKSG